MKKEVMELWTTALESGEYQQTALTLVSVDIVNGDIIGHCCLGVLCELAVQQGVNVERGGGTRTNDYEPDDPRYTPDDDYFPPVTFDGGESYLPLSVMDWAGMKSKNGVLSGLQSLSFQNDSGVPFSEISEIIRTNYEAL